ncbi:MAG: ribbon-helix-helix protein, CopG family [Acidobacteriota bacterium]
MRTTIRLDDHLLAKVKKLAAETGRTLTAVIEDSLRQVIGRRQKRRKQVPVRLRTVTGRGLRAGVDLDDSAAVLDVMEGDAASRR